MLWRQAGKLNLFEINEFDVPRGTSNSKAFRNCKLLIGLNKFQDAINQDDMSH